MQRKYYQWTDDELSLLTRLYPTADKRFLIANLRNRKWSAIQKKAQKLELAREIEKYNDMSELLKETVEAYYWLGFLMADGSFTKNRISLAISGDDLDHLKRLENLSSPQIRFPKSATITTASNVLTAQSLERFEKNLIYIIIKRTTPVRFQEYQIQI